jgi:hypothetical protein
MESWGKEEKQSRKETSRLEINNRGPEPPVGLDGYAKTGSVVTS